VLSAIRFSVLNLYPNLSQYAANRAQIVQSLPNRVYSSQQLRGEPERNHPFAKPFWGPKNSNEGSNPSSPYSSPKPRFRLIPHRGDSRDGREIAPMRRR
jgi:hypothetical protein